LILKILQIVLLFRLRIIFYFVFYSSQFILYPAFSWGFKYHRQILPIFFLGILHERYEILYNAKAMAL